MAVGGQYPGNTTDYDHEVVNIYPVFANDQTGIPEVVAWEYVMGSGSMYIQGNQKFQNFWDNVAIAILPFANALESGGISSMNSTQANEISS